MRQWTRALYHAFTAPDNLTPLNSFCALVAPIVEWQTPPDGTPDTPVAGVAKPGFWTMMKLDQNWSGYSAAIAVLQPYAQTPNAPDNVFAGDGS